TRRAQAAEGCSVARASLTSTTSGLVRSGAAWPTWAYRALRLHHRDPERRTACSHRDRVFGLGMTRSRLRPDAAESRGWRRDDDSPPGLLLPSVTGLRRPRANPHG